MVIVNYDDEVLIVFSISKLNIFKDEPKIGAFYYDGGKHCLLMRDVETPIICDYLNEGVREFIKKCEYILIYTYNKQEVSMSNKLLV